MTVELTLLAWTLVLAIVQIILPSLSRTRETGMKYNAGPRDEAGPPVGVITARLRRAQTNLFETLPLFIAAILIAHIAARNGALTLTGAWLYLLARLVYVPIYGFGIPVIRGLIWGVSMLGLILILIGILLPN